MNFVFDVALIVPWQHTAAVTERVVTRGCQGEMRKVLLRGGVVLHKPVPVRCVHRYVCACLPAAHTNRKSEAPCALWGRAVVDGIHPGGNRASWLCHLFVCRYTGAGADTVAFWQSAAAAMVVGLASSLRLLSVPSTELYCIVAMSR